MVNGMVVLWIYLQVAECVFLWGLEGFSPEGGVVVPIVSYQGFVYVGRRLLFYLIWAGVQSPGALPIVSYRGCVWGVVVPILSYLAGVYSLSSQP